MTTRQALDLILLDLPEDRLNELLDFARFLSTEQDRGGWAEFGRLQLAKAFGSDEPEYTEADLKPELNP
jgi:hypothetical protein